MRYQSTCKVPTSQNHTSASSVPLAPPWKKSAESPHESKIFVKINLVTRLVRCLRNWIPTCRSTASDITFNGFRMRKKGTAAILILFRSARQNLEAWGSNHYSGCTFQYQTIFWQSLDTSLARKCTMQSCTNAEHTKSLIEPILPLAWWVQINTWSFGMNSVSLRM